MSLACLHQVSCRGESRVIGGAFKSVGTGAVREIVESAAADVWKVNAKAELMLGVRVGDEICAVEMILRAS